MWHSQIQSTSICTFPSLLSSLGFSFRRSVQGFIQLLHTSRDSFPGGSEVKASACNVGDPGSIPGLGRSPGEGNGNPLQYSCLENPMDRGAWQATVHGVSKSWTQLSDFTSLHFTSETANSPLRRQQFCIQILVLNSPRISLCEPTSAIQAKEDALRFPPAGSYLVKGQNTVASSLPLPHQILLALLYFSKVIL